MTQFMTFPRITISGARGIVGQDLTVENAMRMAWAYARYIGGGDVVVGRDSRPTGAMIQSAVTAGLLAGGARPVLIGPVPTPTIGIMIRTLPANGGVNITASHNPVPWNALKFYGSDGSFPEESFVDGYIRFLQHETPSHVTWSEVQELLTDESALETHCHLVEQSVDVNKIRRKEFRVAVDGCRSVGGVYLPALLKRLGCTVVPLDCEPDGKFTRGLEPIPEHLGALCETVLVNGADLGIAADPDADRLAIVSNEGKAIGEEFTLALSAYGALMNAGGGTVVTNLSTSLLVDYAARLAGGTVIRTPIGEANVAKGIRDYQALIGGEGNGGVMYPAVHNGRDSLTAAALLLSLLADTGKSVSDLVAEFPNYVIVKDKVELDLPLARKKIAEIGTLQSDARIDDRDGLKLIWPDSWLHLRCSNTEPIVRIIAEARGEDEARALIRQGKQMMGV